MERSVEMKKVLVVSDLHVGSNVALMPDEVIIEPSDKQRAQRIESNEVQKGLYKNWLEMISDVGRVDACFVLGDSCDGSNQKSRGFELWTSNLHQQVSTAADLLGMIRTSNYYGVQGSFYHVSENTSSDLAVIESLEKCKKQFGTDLVVNIGGKRMHLAHEISFSTSPVSKFTALQRELTNSALYKQFFGTFDLILRGHIHESRMIQDVQGMVVTAPCWKMRDSYMAKKGLSSAPQIGFILLNIGDEIDVEINRFPYSSEKLFKEVSL
jgi:predicted phosphodiesterase